MRSVFSSRFEHRHHENSNSAAHAVAGVHVDARDGRRPDDSRLVRQRYASGSAGVHQFAGSQGAARALLGEPLLPRRLRVARHPRSQRGHPGARPRNAKRDQTLAAYRIRSLHHGPAISGSSLTRIKERAFRCVVHSGTHGHGLHRSHGAARAARIVRARLHQRRVPRRVRVD